MALLSQSTFNDNPFTARMNYIQRVSGGSGTNTNVFNESFPLEVIKPSGWLNYNSGTRKIVIGKNGYYSLNLKFRGIFTINVWTSVATAAKFDFNLIVKNSVVAKIYNYGSQGGGVQNFKGFSYYDDSTSSSPVTGTTVNSFGFSANFWRLTADGVYTFSENYIFNENDEIYLNWFNTPAMYSSPAVTAPEGNVKVQNMEIEIYKLP